MSDDALIRAYTPADRAACLALFDSNTPRFFDPSERPDFEGFLDAPNAALLVAELPGRGLVGFGGYYLRSSNPGEGGLAWGMVRNDLHRSGIGRSLMRARLDALRGLGATFVSVRTSQHSRGFFERLGFTAVRTEPDGFAPGIDLVELHYRLESAQ